MPLQRPGDWLPAAAGLLATGIRGRGRQTETAATS